MRQLCLAVKLHETVMSGSLMAESGEGCDFERNVAKYERDY